MLNGLDLFSGIGGLSIGLNPWVRTVAYCEQDTYAQAVLLSRMRDGTLHDAPIWDDVRTLSTKHIRGPIDIIFGGFPCQDISIAQKNPRGIEGERSGLFFEIIRLARDFRPPLIFLENVPAITNRGLEQVLLELVALGFNCKWTIISAGELGAPHLRERWWLLAYANRERLLQPRLFTDEKGEFRKEPRASTFASVQKSIWSQSASVVSRMDDGLRPKTHRIRCLGNAVVPLQAREAFKKLSGIEEE